MERLTVLGGKGFVGSEYLRQYGNNSVHVNDKQDYNVSTPDVLYFISTVHNYNIYKDTHLDINTNLNTLISVLDNWNKNSNRGGCFNFISSWFVYGKGPNGEAIRKNVSEEEVCNPRGFYSITKRAAEQLLIEYCNTFDLHYRILRLGNVVGPGDTKVGKQKNMIQFLIQELKNNNNIFLTHNGQWHRDYIHNSDVSQAINLILNKGEQDTIYNVGNGDKASWKVWNILAYCRRILKSQSMILPDEYFEIYNIPIDSFTLNNDKIIQLGYSPKYINENLWDSLIM